QLAKAVDIDNNTDYATADRLAMTEASLAADAAANATGKVRNIGPGDQTFVHNVTRLSVQAVDPAARTVTFTAAHGLYNRDSVVSRAAVGTPIDPLVEGQTYYVIKVGDQTIKLVTDQAAAAAGDATAALEVRLGQSTSYYDPDWPDNSAHAAAVSTRNATGQR